MGNASKFLTIFFAAGFCFTSSYLVFIGLFAGFGFFFLVGSLLIISTLFLLNVKSISLKQIILSVIGASLAVLYILVFEHSPVPLILQITYIAFGVSFGGVLGLFVLEGSTVKKYTFSALAASLIGLLFIYSLSSLLALQIVSPIEGASRERLFNSSRISSLTIYRTVIPPAAQGVLDDGSDEYKLFWVYLPDRSPSRIFFYVDKPGFVVDISTNDPCLHVTNENDKGNAYVGLRFQFIEDCLDRRRDKFTAMLKIRSIIDNENSDHQITLELQIADWGWYLPRRI